MFDCKNYLCGSCFFELVKKRDGCPYCRSEIHPDHSHVFHSSKRLEKTLQTDLWMIYETAVQSGAQQRAEEWSLDVIRRNDTVRGFQNYPEDVELWYALEYESE